MRCLHTMVRIKGVASNLKYYRGALGSKAIRRVDGEKGRFTLIFRASIRNKGTR
jgi:lactoylglutathione lyase